VGQFYFRQKKYRAALKRFETIARNYPNIGLDYKLEYYIDETKRRLAEEETIRILKEKSAKKS
jgi:outer membrane protein assembly factor BamD